MLDKIESFKREVSLIMNTFVRLFEEMLYEFPQENQGN